MLVDKALVDWSSAKCTKYSTANILCYTTGQGHMREMLSQNYLSYFYDFVI